MKSLKKILSMMATIVLLSVTPTLVKAAASPTPIVNNANQTIVMQTRLFEINEMDKSTLTRAEKKALRDEVKEIKKVADGGIYISVGAIIIILLLLIILF